MNYLPDPSKWRMWDTWVYVTEEGEIHLFYLSHKPGGPGEYIGRARSRDWLHWEDLPTLRISGEKGEWDEGALGTGTTFRYEDGRYYMSYTAFETGEGQCHGLMVSDDLLEWEKVTKDGPVWRRTDEPPYEQAANRITRPDFRDSFVTRNPSGQWEAVCCARADAGPAAGRGCLARCRLEAIDRWVTLPPLAVTGIFPSTEVPEIFSFAGRHWVTFNTGCGWGVRLQTPERPAPGGTFYLSSPNWEGPYEARPNNLLIGASHNRNDAFVARTVEYGGERLVYHHYGCKSPTSLGLPKRLDAEGDRLFLRPWDGLRGLWQEKLELGGWQRVSPGPVTSDVWQWNGGEIRGACEYGASAIYNDTQARALDFEAEVVILDGARAGLLTGFAPEEGHMIVVCLLDVECGQITIGGSCLWEPGSGPNLSQVLDRCHRPVEYGRPYRLRVIQRNRFTELYVDDELIFSTVTGIVPIGGGIACAVESADARFRFLRAHAIEPNDLLAEVS